MILFCYLLHEDLFSYDYIDSGTYEDSSFSCHAGANHYTHSMPKTILITWSSGFIGFHLAKAILERGEIVIWYDNENSYYDVSLKHDRRAILEQYDSFYFVLWDLEDRPKLEQVFQDYDITHVVNLAAQAWVRYSLENPSAYIQSNLVGFFNIIDLAKTYSIQNFVYASSSSVYGSNTKIPFAVTDTVDHPISLYAATKKSNELIAHTYSHLYHLPTTGLRFFTVYGPRGRPDMAMRLFTDKISKWLPIDVYNHGKMQRDFTYIDDIVDGIIRSLDHPKPYEIYNLGNHQPVELEHMISCIEHSLWKQAIKHYMDIQPGDVQTTYADIDHTTASIWRQASTPIEEGVDEFVKWFERYKKQQ